MAWTDDDLAKIEEAIKNGVLEVEYSTGRVKYQSRAELVQTRNLMLRELGRIPAAKRFTAKTSKGL